MIPLHETFRPRAMSEFVGNVKAVKQCQALIAQGIGGRALWLAGASGTGKTTLARLLADSIADRFCTVEYDSGDRFTQAEVDQMADVMGLHGWGKGGRVWIVNEAHALRAPIVRQLLGIIERLPQHCAIIFTTTNEGQERLFDDDIDAKPLLSRCTSITLTNQGLSAPFADRLLAIAQAQGIDIDAKTAARIVKDAGNNLRRAIGELETLGLARNAA